jgi:hypothetical protein
MKKICLTFFLLSTCFSLSANAFNPDDYDKPCVKETKAAMRTYFASLEVTRTIEMLKEAISSLAESDRKELLELTFHHNLKEGYDDLERKYGPPTHQGIIKARQDVGRDIVVAGAKVSMILDRIISRHREAFEAVGFTMERGLLRGQRDEPGIILRKILSASTLVQFKREAFTNKFGHVFIPDEIQIHYQPRLNGKHALLFVKQSKPETRYDDQQGYWSNSDGSATMTAPFFAEFFNSQRSYSCQNEDIWSSDYERSFYFNKLIEN